MDKAILILIAILFVFSCEQFSTDDLNIVKTSEELNEAIKHALPGDEIVMANGIWKDVQIKFYGKGRKSEPITLRAETPGKVFVEGRSYLYLGGENLIVDGLYFRNGSTPSRSVIRYKISSDSIAFHSIVQHCVIEDFNQANRFDNDQWIEFYGKHNQLRHCYIAGKSNDGATLMVYHNGNEHINNDHQIVNNYFGPRPRKGGPRAETMRLGGSETSMTPGRVNVSNNFFEACNGEVEVISDKTNYNSFTNNIFYKCEGSLVIRHGNYATVDANIFIGGDESDFYGGIRAVNTGHWFTNNYFYKIRGSAFRSPLAIMNGIPKSSLNRYKQVTDLVVAHNTWVDCKSPWQIGVGQNKASANVLPPSEIRSAPPIRTIIANNLIYNRAIDSFPIVNHDEIDGVTFKNNILDNNGYRFARFEAFDHHEINMKQVNEWLIVPENSGNEVLDSVYHGFEFDKIKNDLFATPRSAFNRVGAVSKLTAAESFSINKAKYGPSWFTPSSKIDERKIHLVSSKDGELARRINQSNAGDIITLTDSLYVINSSVKIDKEITIRSKNGSKAKLMYNGEGNTPLFELNPKASLSLEQIDMIGQGHQMAFSPLEINMSSAYKLFVDDCNLSRFSYVLEASKGSFADSLYFSDTKIINCENGFWLAADEKGDYNAEMVTFENCEFKKISQNVINYYRGGYDESTIGGYLTLTNSTFSACGQNETSGILIKTKGIINVILEENTFLNNQVNTVALLWGEKNNHHRNNTMINSGQIKVEEQQKLELLY